MGSAVPLEKSADEEPILDIGEDRIYRGNRISAAIQFAREVSRENINIFKDSLKDFKLWISPFYIMPLIGPVTASATCYAFTPVTSFLYSSLTLKFSNDKQGYVFDRTTSDRLSVVG